MDHWFFSPFFFLWFIWKFEIQLNRFIEYKSYINRNLTFSMHYVRYFSLNHSLEMYIEVIYQLPTLCVCVCVCRPKTDIYPCIKQISSLSIMFIIRNKQTKQQKCKISSPILLLYWAIVYLCFEENCMIELPTFFFLIFSSKKENHIPKMAIERVARWFFLFVYSSWKN